MAQSLSKILLHLVFSTKNREPLIEDLWREKLHGIAGGIIANHGGHLLKVNSVYDHIHLLLVHPRTIAPSDIVREIKTGSTHWIKRNVPGTDYFHWQSGFGLFSVSPSHRAALEQYIANQAEHHRTETFQDEFRRLLKKYEIEWDERFVWN